MGTEIRLDIGGITPPIRNRCVGWWRLWTGGTQS